MLVTIIFLYFSNVIFLITTSVGRE